MSTRIASLPEVFSTLEIARAAGVSTAEVRAILDESSIIPIRRRFLTQDQAIEAITLLKARAAGRHHERRLFAPRRGTARRAGMPALASGAAHAGLLAVVVLLGTMAVRTEPVERKPSISSASCSWRRPAPAAEAAAVAFASPSLLRARN